MKSKNLLALAGTMLMSFSALTLFAQSSPPPPPAPGAPIDGGILALVIGAAILGYKNLRNKGN